MSTAVAALVADGQVEAGSSFVKAVEEFVKTTEGKLADVVEPVPKPVIEDKDRTEMSDPGTVYRVLVEAAGRSGSRGLIHLIDVQRSVQGNLRKFLGKQAYVHRNDDELEPEVDAEVKERNESIVVKALGWSPEGY